MFLSKTNCIEFSVAIPYKIHMLWLRTVKNETSCSISLGLYKPSAGSVRHSAIVYKLILPKSTEANADKSWLINSQYLARVCDIAEHENSGIAVLYSNPGESIDFKGFLNSALLVTSVSKRLELPIVDINLSIDNSWNARAWEYENNWEKPTASCTVRIVGKALKVSYDDVLRPLPVFKESYKRTRTVWGQDNHNKLARLRVGIVGLGSVGSMVAEALARMGIERFVLIDFDEVQEHNLDRLMGATKEDIGSLKTYVAQRQIEKSATGNILPITAVPNAITEEFGYRNALDCDVLFSCVDRPWPREVLNHIAYNHLIPVVDGGIKVRFNTDSSEFEGAEWQSAVVGPERICLNCLGQYESADAATEKSGLLEDPSYMHGLPKNHMFKVNENIFPFSMNLASLEVLQLVEMVTGIGNQEYFGTQRYCYNEGYIRVNSERKCEDSCLFHNFVGTADSIFLAPIGFDYAADKAKKRQ
jgi:molybdopterin/thiamine biosynthesis adenylyltransferase